MFLFGEKIENRTFLPILTPQKRNLVGPSETIWPLFRIWGSTSLEPQIRQSNVHCCPRQNLKSGIPDLRFLYNVQWKWNLKSGKVTIPPQKWPNLVAKKVKMRAPKKAFPESIWTRTFCKKTDPNWSFLASAAPFTIYTPPIGGYHRVLDFTTQITEKYSTAMCYSVTVPMAEQPLINPRSFPILASVREDAKVPDILYFRRFYKGSADIRKWSKYQW